MKGYQLLAILTIVGMLLSSCSALGNYTCSDPLGCVVIKSGESIKVATLLTMSGPNQAYGIDAVRGVEIAVADTGKLLNHPIELVKADDQCDAKAGEAAAAQLAADKQIVGVIGATCSSASVPAAKVLTEAGMVLISPSSTAPSLTDPSTHQAGFFRAIYNDKAQGKAVAEFAFNVLGLRRMLTFHDGTAYPEQLQQAACDSFEALGGRCVDQINLSIYPDALGDLRTTAANNPDVIYFPVYTKDGINIVQAVPHSLESGAVMISSDGLLSRDFIQQTEPASEGMYLSGPAPVSESQAFTQKYKARYGEDPIAAYHLQGYDAANMLFNAIRQVAQSAGNTLYIPRQKLREALYATHNLQGLSATITCSPTGDCAQPNIEIYQVVNGEFKPVYP
jgi:branched-chain amino acid transport system substrate-binding protein